MENTQFGKKENILPPKRNGGMLEIYICNYHMWEREEEGGKGATTRKMGGQYGKKEV